MEKKKKNRPNRGGGVFGRRGPVPRSKKRKKANDSEVKGERSHKKTGGGGTNLTPSPKEATSKSRKLKKKSVTIQAYRRADPGRLRETTPQKV